MINNREKSDAKGVPTAKKPWSKPVLTRMVAGSAESQRGNVADGGGGFQGS
ncbi:hypothetical protein GCM10022280_22450 [Sphingomonas swuensis]|uniref:Uncharacterized protein n=1 Tax=Sphingomonas swuensis TaxID=977800 RepID=A0ABP7T5Z7_9SPHN